MKKVYREILKLEIEAKKLNLTDRLLIVERLNRLCEKLNEINENEIKETYINIAEN